MKYYVTIKVSGEYIMEVDGNSFEEARQTAENNLNSVDFNQIECVDMEATSAENENGNSEYFD